MAGDDLKISRARFGRLLRKLRAQMGFTQQELSASSTVGQSTISDLELGKKGTQRDYVVLLDSALTAHGVLIGAWDASFSEGGTSAYFREVAESEQTAIEIREYSLGLVPGLLQIEEYARGISMLARPRAEPESIDKIVAARRHRQELLDRAYPPAMTVLLDESVLLRRFHDPGIMDAQIQHLVKQSKRPRLRIQIVPLNTEGHAGLGGAFTLMEVPDTGTFVYVESQETGFVLKQPEVVASYERTFAELRSAALPVPESRAKMEEIRGNIR
ncbi:Scr1 family TA system antitoxin-like transcriptional regulator [Nocardiopsis sp. N85]|uniref:Scr1 family TA system antitoxin-like transcriptional regulator n=1 Tax=Nocardiopsis sp. N85 TaxID=3029400 RepID=UPI00237FD368|nr:Scr1 family TA system antitoxin-like transcriptional regulator [Nocardiopsis sp. N85]MDE3722144.1 Scr1 family TA system antitoxin-like transcriptional regulator [Nocardiopsis sp. N85]